MSDPDSSLDHSITPPAASPHRRMARRPLLAAAALAAAFVVGAGASTLVLQRPQVTIAALAPAPIASMVPWSTVAVKGEVAELFGNKFVLQDESGRALVDTGPAGDDSPAVLKSETVTVQGRFDRGVVHAIAIGHADGRTEVIGPPGPPGPRGPLAWLDRHWLRFHWLRADTADGPATRG